MINLGNRKNVKYKKIKNCDIKYQIQRGERMKIDMFYNPYNLDTIIIYNGTDLMQNSRLSRYRGRRLQFWVEDIFTMLEDELNDDRYVINFTGTSSDFADLQELKMSYPKVSLNHVPVIESTNKARELKNLINSLKDAPVPSMRDTALRDKFVEEIEEEFQVTVVATMSSGKSTLINALLGIELLPSKVKSCTAKITKIKNVPGKKTFDAIGYDELGKSINSIKDADLNALEHLNQDEKIHRVSIEGEIPFIRNKQINVTIVDTPGPNSSLNETHKLHTMELIKSDDSLKPLVLYILNASQLGVDEDHHLLHAISTQMEKSGKDSKDRFIFVLNKADKFDPEKSETIEEAIQDVKAHLEKIDIQNPRIFPVSAEAAKLIMKLRQGLDLTRKEKSDHQYLMSLFLEESSMRLNTYAPLDSKRKSEIDMAAEITRDRDEKVLHYAGMTSLAEAINGYLDKYAVPSKIFNAVNVIREQVLQLEAELDLKSKISNNQSIKQETLQIIRKIESDISKQDKIEELVKDMEKFREKIDVKILFDDINRNIFNRLNEVLKQPFSNVNRLRKEDAEASINRTVREIEKLQIDAVTDIENQIDIIIKSQIQKMFDAYQKHIKDIIAFQNREFDTSIWQLALKSPEINAEKVMKQSSFRKREEIGERYILNEDWQLEEFWKILKKIKIHENVDYVDMKKLSEDILLSTEENIEALFEQAINFTDAKLIEFERFFREETERFNQMTLSKLEEMCDYVQKADDLEEEERRLSKSIEWIQYFLLELDKIIQVEVREDIKS